MKPWQNVKYHLFAMSLIGIIAHFSLFSSQGQAKTYSVVTFNSEYGLILIDSNHSRAAYDLFETLNVPIQNSFFAQTKIFAPKDKSFRIACTAYGLNHICAVIVYPGKYASLNFDTDEIRLDLPSLYAEKYKGAFVNASKEFHLQTEDKRLKIDWSEQGLSIRNFLQKSGDHLNKEFKPDLPGIEL